MTDACAIITGGGTGLGKAIAAALAIAGWRVVITGRREDVLIGAIGDLPDGVVHRVHDVTDLDAHDALVAELEATIGPIGALINNAGRHLKRPFVETDPASLRAVVDTNLLGTVELTRAVVARMLPRGQGRVVMISSMAGLMGLTNVSAYALTKTALIGLTRALAVELGPAGLCVNAICPGFIDTPMFQAATSTDPARRQRIEQRIPLPNLGTPGDVGSTAAFLCSPAARYLNGVVLPVDGGFSVGF